MPTWRATDSTPIGCARCRPKPDSVDSTAAAGTPPLPVPQPVHAPVSPSDLPRTVPITERFEMVRIFREIPPRSKSLRDDFFSVYKHFGGRRYVHTLLQPFPERQRVDKRNGHVNRNGRRPRPTSSKVSHQHLVAATAFGGFCTSGLGPIHHRVNETKTA